MMKVEIVSRKLIKPSTPTPPHLRSYKLSLLDQFAPTEYMTIVLYYSPRRGNQGGKDENAKRCTQLEKSLAEVLTKFYPLAGRIIDDELLVDCDDQGVDYLEAQVSGELDEFFSKEPHEMKLLDQFVPLDIGPADSVTSPLLAIQINNFNCGGLVVGVRISHKIADAYCCAIFINSWATASRVGIGGVTCPILDMATHLPARTSFTHKFPPPTIGPKLVLKRFEFEGASILALKDKLAKRRRSTSTRVMAVTALLWKVLIRIAQPKHGRLMRRYSMIHFMTLRGKTGLLIPENSFGNMFISVMTEVMAGDERKVEVELEELTGLLGDATRDLKSSFATKLRGDEISSLWISLVEESVKILGERAKEVFHTFSSLCRFPFYEADFGWGKPSWISPAALEGEFCVLMDTKSGDGIEAWVNLKEEDMIQLQRDPDILAYTASACAQNENR